MIGAFEPANPKGGCYEVRVEVMKQFDDDNVREMMNVLVGPVHDPRSDYACDYNHGSSDKNNALGDSARRSANGSSPADNVGFGQSLAYDGRASQEAINDVFSFDDLDPHYTITTYTHASTLQQSIANN